MPVEFLDPVTDESVGVAQPQQRGRPGLGRFAAQGVARGVENTAGLADAVLAAAQPRVRLPVPDAPQAEFVFPADAPTNLAGRARSAANRILGPRVAPETIGERVTESAAAGATEAAPFALIPGGGPAALARRGALEVGSGMLGEVARGEVEAAGGSRDAQLAASLAAGLGGAAGGTLLGSAAQAVGPIRNATAARLTQRALGRKVKDRGQALALLRAEAEQPLFGRATLDQVLGEDFPGVAGLAGRLARGDVGDDLRAGVIRLRRSNAEAAEAFARNAFPGGRPAAAVEEFVSRLEKVSGSVDRAYRGIGTVDVPVQKVKARAAEIAVEAGEELRPFLPRGVLKIVGGYGDTVSLDDIDRLRQRILAETEVARRGGKDRTVRFLNRLNDSIENTLDEVAAATGTENINALRRARGLSRLKQQRFGTDRRDRLGGGGSRRRQDPLNLLLRGEVENLQKGFASFLNRDPRTVEVLNRTRLTLGGNPQAWGGVQELMRAHIFGEDFGDLFRNVPGPARLGGTRTIRKRLSRFGKEFDAVYGTGSTVQANRFLDRVDQLTSGQIARLDDTFAAGLNDRDGGALARAQQAVVAFIADGNPRGAVSAAYHAVTGRLPSTLDEADRLMAQAIIDPTGVGRGFVEQLDSTALQNWQRRVQTFIGQPVRATAGTVSGDPVLFEQQ